MHILLFVFKSFLGILETSLTLDLTWSVSYQDLYNTLVTALYNYILEHKETDRGKNTVFFPPKQYVN